MNLRLSGLIAATILVVSATSPATAFTMKFQGTALTGSGGDVSAYEGDYQTTSFEGEPVDISLSISGSPWGLYVDSFVLSWSGETYAYPFVTAFAGDGFPSDPDSDPGPGFLSSVSLTSSGGTINISPNGEWISETDGDFGLLFSFTYSKPHAVGSTFTDPALSGSGGIAAGYEDVFDPRVGLYDADSQVSFGLSSLIEAPEPATWALMLIGLGCIGSASRARRGLRAPQPKTWSAEA